MSLLALIVKQSTKTSSSLRDERGFTLIETMLSLSILVIMIGLVLSSMRLGQKAWEKGENAIKDGGTRRFVIKKLGTDVASMYPYVENRNGHDTYIFKGLSNEFAFVTAHKSASTDLPWGGAVFVSYAVSENGLRIVEKTVPLALDSGIEAHRLIELDPDVESVRFSYLGANGWQGTWNLAATKSLPSTVRVELFYRDNKRPLKITLPVGVNYDSSADKTAGLLRFPESNINGIKAA